MIVTVFGGSSEKIAPSYCRAARELGRLIAERGWTQMNGAGKGASSMGCCTDGGLDAGGRVRGVIASRFRHLQHPRLTGVLSFRHLRDRKKALLKSDAFIILPGGFGTLDEIGEVLTLKQAGFIDRPIVFLNTRGFFNGLLRFLEHTARQGFARNRDLRLYRVVRTPREAVRAAAP
jgi:uncharacterized protein (TIGR00730 family)